MGRPNCSRSLAYLVECSIQAAPTPTALAAEESLVESSIFMQILNPPFFSPIRASLGIFASSKIISPVGAQCRPNFVSMAFCVIPGPCKSTIKQEIPLCFNSLSVEAKIIPTSARGTPEIHILEPVRTHPSSVSVAVVFMLATSEPVSASVMAKHDKVSALTSPGRCFSRCSSVPQFKSTVWGPNI